MSETKNPHAWFFSYLKKYCDESDKMSECRKLVYEFSDRKTNSLSVMYKSYPDKYRKMKDRLQDKNRAINNELDNSRKRLIAVLFSFLKNNDETPPTMQYVKTVACKAAKVDTFNSIPLNQLKSLYRIFGAKNTKDWTESDRELVCSALRKENRN